MSRPRIGSGQFGLSTCPKSRRRWSRRTETCRPRRQAFSTRRVSILWRRSLLGAGLADLCRSERARAFAHSGRRGRNLARRCACSRQSGRCGGRLCRSANLARDDSCLAPVSPRTEGRNAGDRFRWRVRVGETSRLASRTRLRSRSSEWVTCLNPLYPCHLFKSPVTLLTVAIASPLQSPPGAGWFGASHLPGNRRPHPIHRHRWIFECR